MRKKILLISCMVNIVLITAFGIIMIFYTNLQQHNITILNEFVYRPMDELTLRKAKVMEMQVYINQILFVDPYWTGEINTRLWETEQSRQHLFELLGNLVTDSDDIEIITELGTDYKQLLDLYGSLDVILQKRNRSDYVDYADRIAHVQGNIVNLINLKIEKCRDYGNIIQKKSEENGGAVFSIVIVTMGVGIIFNMVMMLIKITGTSKNSQF